MEEFQPDTIVRRINSGEFGKIVKRCICGSGQTPIHYEVLVDGDMEGSYRVTIYNHTDLELECLPGGAM
jgi:hypothetical protein